MPYVGILGFFRQICRGIWGDQFGRIQHSRNFASDRLLPSWHESTVCFCQGSYVEFIQNISVFHFSWLCISQLEFALRAYGGEDGSYCSMNIGTERWREDYGKQEQKLNLANISTRASENVYM